MGRALNIILRSVDADAAAFCRRSGAEDKRAVSAFVRGVKALGLWEQMVCWPLRSSQNAGTGTTAFSLGGLGTYNGTLVNGPTWGADGVVTSGNTQSITTSVMPTQYVTLCAVKSVSSLPLSTGWSRNVYNDGGTTAVAHGFTHDANLVFDHPQFSNRLLVASPSVTANVPFMLLSTARASGSQSYFNAISVGTNATAPSAPGAVNAYRLFSNVQQPHTFNFVLIMQQALSDVDVVPFYNLYKSTLGQGLALP